MLWDLRRENRMYVGQIQVGIYKAASEEGASTTRTPLTEGPPPVSCLQAGNPARQRYIVSEEQERVVSPPPGAAREGPVNYPWENRHLGGAPQDRSGKMSDSFWQDVLPECPWPEDQGDRD